MKNSVLRTSKPRRRTDNPEDEIIFRNTNKLEDSVLPSESPSPSRPQISSPRLLYVLYSTSAAPPSSTTGAIDSEPSLGVTGRIVSIVVLATMLLLLCIGVASYFRWRQQTRFYKEKGQVLRIWNNNHSRREPSPPTPTSSTVSELDNSRRSGLRPSIKATASSIAADAHHRTQGFKMKLMMTSRPTWRPSRSLTTSSPAVTVPPVAVTFNRHAVATASDPPAVPSTFALAGYVPDPVVGAYMDNARRQYAAHLAKTGNYPPHYLNPITAPNLLAPTVPASLPSSTRQDSDVFSSSSSIASRTLRKKPRSIWERASDRFSNRHSHSTGRSRVSKNHVSRFFQENARPHSHPLYAPRYDSDDEDGEEEDLDEEEGDCVPAGQDKEGRAYRHPNDFMVRTPMTVQEAQAAAARIMAMGEERKMRMPLSPRPADTSCRISSDSEGPSTSWQHIPEHT